MEELDATMKAKIRRGLKTYRMRKDRLGRFDGLEEIKSPKGQVP